MNSALNPIPAKKPLPLPVGNSDWAVGKAGYWSADKTQLISGLLDRSPRSRSFRTRFLRFSVPKFNGGTMTGATIDIKKTLLGQQ